MSDTIRVSVSRHGAGRKNLVMYYVDPTTEKRVTRSTGTAIRREADRVAAVWEDELNSGRYVSANKVTWQEFRQRYEDEKLATLSEGTLETAAATLNLLERVIKPARLGSVTAAAIGRFQTELRKRDVRDTTLDRHLRHLRAALNWAVSMGLLAKLPKINRPKRVKGRRLMRGRPITTEEFERMLAAVPKVRPHDKAAWVRYLTGLWLSGLRLEESLILSWGDDSPICVDLAGRHPRLRIYGEAEKGGRDRLLPVTPDFTEFLLETPEDERRGRVFRLTDRRTGKRLHPNHVGRIVSAIGRRASVVVNKADGKFASAHDLRRSYGTRWAPRVKPATLQLLMRHASIETTMAYYVDQDADEVADELWRGHVPTLLPTVGDSTRKRTHSKTP